MRKPLRPKALSLEVLESRLTPSLMIQPVSGLLLISGTPTDNSGPPAGGLHLNLTANNKVQVLDGTTSLGTFSASSVSVNLASRPNAITVDLGGFTLSGSFSLNLGAGDTLAPTDPITFRNGTIAGNLTVQKGNGQETIHLGLNQGEGRGPRKGMTPFRVGGSATLGLAPGTGPGETVLLDGQASIGGSLALTDVANVLLDGPDFGSPTASSVGQDVTINDSLDRVALNAVFAGNVGRNVQVQGTSLGDSVDISTSTIPGIRGSVTFALGAGDNFFAIDDLSGGGRVIGGNLTFTAGSGNNTIGIGAEGLGAVPTAINGNLSIQFGDGSNDLSGLGQNVPLQVGGTMSITLGNGDNFPFAVNAVVPNLTFNLGNGNDTVSVVNAPAGLLRWVSGNGNDQLVLGGGTAAGSTWNLNARFGSGDDTLTLAAGLVAQTLTGSADGGGHQVANVFEQDPAGWTLQNFTLVNFP